MTQPDGNLPAARRRLTYVVDDLTAPQPHWLGGRIRYTDSRYDQLRQDVRGRNDHERANGHSGTPLWTDAFDLLTKIDRTVRSWYRGATPQPTVCAQLTVMTRHRWRPQDTTLLEHYAADLEAWVKSIDGLLIDRHTKELDAPCPICGTDTVLRHKDGEWLRTAALQLDTQVCLCLKCRRTWPSDDYRFLARLIGCDTPIGVLE